MADWKLPENYQKIEDLDKDAHEYAKTEGVTIGQALDDLGARDPQARNYVVARGVSEAMGWNPQRSASAAEEYHQKRQSVMETPSISDQPETSTYDPGWEQAGAAQVGLPSPVAEGPVMGGAGVKMPYVPGAGKMREAMGGVTKGLETGEDIRRGQLTRIEEQAWKRRAQLEEAKKYEIEKGRAEAEVYQAQQTEFDRLKTQQIEKEGDRQQDVKTEMSKIQGLISEMQTAKIDPTRFYRHPDGSANLPKSIAAAIAVGLGALVR